MAGRASALALLGLPPGADAAAIEQAYKRLIKQHHPDREGGDLSRAAEINRAYRELRGGKAFADPLQFNEAIDRTPRRSRFLMAALVGAIIIGALVFVMGPSTLADRLPPANSQRPVGKGERLGPEPMDVGLHGNAVDIAVNQALQMFRTKSELALANSSNDCNRRFRENPGTMMLDRCAAFDDAIVGLENRDPMRDEGPFAALAVTGRQWSSAAMLSNDDLAIELAPRKNPSSGGSAPGIAIVTAAGQWIASGAR